jgi:hypothetical protein
LSTDIFMYAERRTETGWSVCGALTSDHGLAFPEPLPEGYLPPPMVYSTRNYSLFAILANVRNPADSAVPYEFIAAPRGLPADLSDGLAAWVANFGDVPHASWLFLRELEEFPWRERRIKKEAMVARSVAPLFASGDGPFPVAQWPKDEPISYSAWKANGVTVRWVESYAESAGDDFLVETLNTLRQCGPPDDVRIVFWFDS